MISDIGITIYCWFLNIINWAIPNWDLPSQFYNIADSSLGSLASLDVLVPAKLIIMCLGTALALEITIMTLKVLRVIK